MRNPLVGGGQKEETGKPRGKRFSARLIGKQNYLQDAIVECLVASFKNHSTQRSFEERSWDRLQKSDYVDTTNNLKNAA